MKKNILLGLFLALTVMSTSVIAKPAMAAEAGEASRASIEKLMAVTGVADSATKMLGQMRKMMPGISQELWNKFIAQVKMEDLTTQIVPIYQKHLTQQDVDAMIKFYATPTGKKMINTMPAIMQESMVTGQRWGQGIAYQLIQMQQAETAKKKQK